MSYQQFRQNLVDKLTNQFGHELLAGHEFDSLPDTFPCHGSCMQDHINIRSRREISPSDPAVLYLPLGGGGSQGCPSLAESAVVGKNVWKLERKFVVIKYIIQL